MARWDMLGLTIFAIVCGYALLTRPERTVKLMFAADKNMLKDRVTLRLWTLYVQLSAVSFMVWSLLPAADFIKSLRS